MASDGALRLLETCLIVLDRSYTDSELRAAIFTRISREQLEKDVATNGALSREDHGNYYEHLCKHYGQVRRFLPGLISEIHFEGNRAGQSVLEALEFLKRHKDSPQSLKFELSQARLPAFPARWRSTYRALRYPLQHRAAALSHRLCYPG